MTILTIQPTKDTLLNEYAPTQNYGTSAEIDIADLLSGCWRPLLEFPLTGLPAGAILNSASLQKYYWIYNPAYTDPVGKTVWAYKLTRADWVEAEATWNRYKTGIDWTVLGGDYLGQEQQVANNAALPMFALGGIAPIRAGQRRTISNSKVTGVAFLLYKYGSPDGNVTFTIRKVSDDSIIQSKVWGAANSLPTSATWEKVMFDSPTNINEEVRVQCEYGGGTLFNRINLRYQNTNVKSGELFTSYISSYTDNANYDAAYMYLYDASGANTVFPASYGWMTWDVLTLVQNAFNGGAPAEFLVRFELEGLPSGYTFGACFHSKEYTTDPTLQPKLVIDYTAPPAGVELGAFYQQLSPLGFNMYGAE